MDFIHVEHPCEPSNYDPLFPSTHKGSFWKDYVAHIVVLRQVIDYYFNELEMQYVFDDNLPRDMPVIIHLMLT